MAYTYEELHGKTVAELREIAKGIEHEAVQGYTQLNKEHLLVALCKALGIEARKKHIVVAANKARIKGLIRAQKTARAAAIAAKDPKKLKEVRRKIHRLKRELRKAQT